MGVNKVILLGNLTADPQFRVFADNSKIATASVATNERYKKDGNIIEHAEYHNIVIRGAMVQVAETYLKKGHKVFIEGVLRHRSYQAADNTPRYVTEVYVSRLEMLTPKNQDTSDTPQSAPPSPPPDDDDLPT